MIEEVKKIASMVWAFGLNRQMEAEGKPVRFSPEDFWEQKLINKNPYFDFTQQICQLSQERVERIKREIERYETPTVKDLNLLRITVCKEDWQALWEKEGVK
ncbi:hypothetical protein LCGC14_2003210 [marine sediment metagenome]|uniref:Uncharacterized protein n=1 Tax=marine sediment metagenome TaxID=412755 RepID=A0A0F9HFZ0_9ZZZZ